MSASALPPSPSFASTTSPSLPSSEAADELLEMRIAETRAQLKALREEGTRQRLEHIHHYQTLQSNFDTLQQTLTKSSSRLNMFAYTHAMLQAQTTVVQPYILKKQALLCHAFHINEVLTKQIHLRQLHADALVAVLEHSTRQVVEFWQARLTHLQQQKRDAQDDVQQWHDRILMLLPPPTATTNTNNNNNTNHLWRFNADEVIIEEEDEDEYDDDDDNMSSSTSSSSQWTEEPSAPPQPHQQDVLLHVLSMALTAVSEGRLPSVFDMKSLSAPPSPTRNTNHNNTSNSHHHTLRTTSSSSTRLEPKQLEDVWDEKATPRRSLVGLEKF